jgi:hypothetical protein
VSIQCAHNRRSKKEGHRDTRHAVVVGTESLQAKFTAVCWNGAGSGRGEAWGSVAPMRALQIAMQTCSAVYGQVTLERALEWRQSPHTGAGEQQHLSLLIKVARTKQPRPHMPLALPFFIFCFVTG